jgi:hypothetical protein
MAAWRGRLRVGVFALILGGAAAPPCQYGVEAPASPPASGKVLYQNDFEQATTVPDEFLVLDGAFSIKTDKGNKFLELAGAPLDTFGVLAGPAEAANVRVSARVFGTGKGLRGPVFGVGLNGGGGYKLQVAPGKKQLELCKGDELLASAPYRWESGSWTVLCLQVRPVAEGQWKIEGKAWNQAAPEPAAWQLTWDETTAPTAGRAALWGSPISGTPIRYDEVRVTRVGK